jgi:hypothetical protein
MLKLQLTRWGLAAALVPLAVAICLPRPARILTAETADRIRLGMNDGQLTAIVGRPPNKAYGLICDQWGVREWLDRGGTLTVMLRGNVEVYGVHWQPGPQPLWPRLRARLGW